MKSRKSEARTRSVVHNAIGALAVYRKQRITTSRHSHVHAALQLLGTRCCARHAWPSPQPHLNITWCPCTASSAPLRHSKTLISLQLWLMSGSGGEIV